MTSTELISAYREKKAGEDLSQLAERISYRPFTDGNGALQDTNIAFRTAVTDQLLHDFSIADIELIRQLTDEEFNYTSHLLYHNRLHQLCYYLYELGQLQDVFRIYNAKYNSKCMDASCMIDREMLKLRHRIDRVIAYVKDQVDTDPCLQKCCPGLLEELYDLFEFPDYENDAVYRKYINGYFLD